jgi:hypothetical protein
LINNGIASSPFAEMGSDVVFSPDSRAVAYCAQAKEKVLLFVNNSQLDIAEEIMDLTFSTDSRALAYWAREGDKWSLSVNGKRSEIGVDVVVGARRNVFDFDNPGYPKLLINQATNVVRGVGKISNGEFIKIGVKYEFSSP